MKRLLFPLVLIGVLFCSFFLYKQSLIQSTYTGLPTVPCIDTTRPIEQSFTFSLAIKVQDKPYPLDTTIGHDYGKCLHDIYVHDVSGKVFVQTNGMEQFTLGDFFTVWHKTFSPSQLFGYQITAAHPCEVFVNGKQVYSYNQTPIAPNEKIEIIYQ